MSEAFPGFVFVVFVVILAGVSIAMVLWGRWVARRHPTAAWRLASHIPLAALGLAALQYATTAYLITRAFGQVSSAMPDQKARMLAEAISEAMNWGAVFGLPALLLYLASGVTFLLGTIRRPE